MNRKSISECKSCPFGRLSGLLVLLALATAAGAQQQKSPPAKAGVVSGSVFAITKGGDLKPARMADVYLLYYYRSVKWANAHPEDEDSAGHAWMRSRYTLMEEYLKARSAEGLDWGENVACLKSLQTYHDALPQTQEWASANHKDWQILSAEADENGTFKVTVPRPGRYIMLAAERAGFNDAFWVADTVDVDAGATTTVKLSSPKEACVVE